MELEICLKKLQRYCAYQERCHQEVRNKLNDLEIRGADKEAIIAALIEHNFLNEERFARAYARGKFRMLKWGRLKIIQGLKQKNISEYCIKKGLAEIDETDYERALVDLLEKKAENISWQPPYPPEYSGDRQEELKNKLAQYLIKKGYEAELVWSIVNKQ